MAVIKEIKKEVIPVVVKPNMTEVLEELRKVKQDISRNMELSDTKTRENRELNSRYESIKSTYRLRELPDFEEENMKQCANTITDNIKAINEASMKLNETLKKEEELEKIVSENEINILQDAIIIKKNAEVFISKWLEEFPNRINNIFKEYGKLINLLNEENIKFNETLKMLNVQESSTPFRELYNKTIPTESTTLLGGDVIIGKRKVEEIKRILSNKK